MPQTPTHQIITTLKQYRVLTFNGEHVRDYLQGQLTCDLRALQVGHGALFAYCNHKGRALATGFILFETLQTYHLILHHSLIETLQIRFTRSAVLSSVEVHSNLNNAALYPIDNAPPSALKTQTLTYALGLSTSEQHNPSIEHEWHDQVLRAGYPMIEASSSDLYTPHMLNLPLITLQETPAVSLTKGCYVGQEIVSRIHHQGQNKKIFRVYRTTTSLPPPPLELLDHSKNLCGQSFQHTHTQHESHLGGISRTAAQWVIVDDQPILLSHTE
ncbi:MAG: hypothetical protein CMF51_04960 [Legionellales bacterium]|nr:hypothetical protein [Legionellales bacterium]